MDNVDLCRIYGIEQPLPVDGQCKSMPFYFIADESFSHHGYAKIHRYGYNAFIFKPFANNFSEFYKAVQNNNNYWGAVGSNISGPLDCSFVNLVNSYLPIQTATRTNSHFINHPLNNHIDELITTNKGRFIVSDKVQWYLTKYCDESFAQSFKLSV